MTPPEDRLRQAVPDRFESLVSGVRFGQFVSVGVVGAACDTTVLLVLTEVFGVLPELATLAGIETAILVMFAINERWTFADEGDPESLPRRLLRSHVVRAGGSTTQFLVFVVIYRLLFVPLSVAGIDLWILVAKGGGIGLGMLVNYVFESIFTWQVHHEE
ncbi:GtrA family protein [Halomicroarcula sp. GCM10025709]|uniref:GtrA family protein n=1 Tax=Haloarcula TaxID=2237 RepID=UPI0024C43051|nr:GtrA family protein [Halomicroarcula sp. YJ-61-S]